MGFKSNISTNIGLTDIYNFKRIGFNVRKGYRNVVNKSMFHRTFSIPLYIKNLDIEPNIVRDIAFNNGYSLIIIIFLIKN